MSKKPRYVVMIKGGKTLYRGNSRLLAWTIWLVNRRHKAIAYDCGIWGHCCKVSDEAAFCLIQRPYISKTLLTRRISPRGSP